MKINEMELWRTLDEDKQVKKNIHFCVCVCVCVHEKKKDTA